ncbi:MAG: phenylalanine--tRNA ligase subunit beta [Planctomycetota bacterium]|nr:MAG: phenylalanine--tRNA ligase subunit beta [Planctomycetota bacterium]
MRISLNWISDYVDLSGHSPEELALKFTMSTAEVDEVIKLGDKVSGVLTGECIDVYPHPNADQNVLAKVKFSDSAPPVEVVCGAPNLAAGQKVVFAPLGSSVVNPETGGPFKLRKTKIRGVESNGMILAEDELGIGDDHTVTIELDPETPIGLPVHDVIPLNDVVFEIDNKSITHRPDLWGHYGIAREFAAILGRELKPLETEYPEGSGDPLRVEVHDFDLCPRYCAIVLSGIKVGESPLEIKCRLAAAGMRPINSVVDATNYVMLELGQPLHAFDSSLLGGDAIIVRRAKKGETITTLHEGKSADIPVDENMLMIADAERPIAVAGVVGGKDSGILDNTTRMVLESANFNPTSIRMTAQRLKLRTEASMRFEKALDPKNALDGVGRFINVLSSMNPGLVMESKLYDVCQLPPPPKPIALTREACDRLLGKVLPGEEITGILTRLGFGVKREADSFEVIPPSWRATRDVSIPEDLIEEIGRMHGYDNITPQAPKVALAPPPQSKTRHLVRSLRKLLAYGLGLAETMNYSFDSTQVLKAIDHLPDDRVYLRNPITEDQEAMRWSLVPNLLRNVATNWRNTAEFGLFEFGKIYRARKDAKPGELPDERFHLCIMLYSREPDRDLFPDLRGIVDRLAEFLGAPDLASVEGELPELPWIHPKKSLSVKLGETGLGYITEVHPSTGAALEIEGACAACVVDVDKLAEKHDAKPGYEPIPKYPGITLDVAVAVDENVPWSEMESTIRSAGGKYFRNVKFFDLYRGEQVGEGRKSVAFSVHFRSETGTMKMKSAEKARDAILRTLEQKLGAVIRTS